MIPLPDGRPETTQSTGEKAVASSAREDTKERLGVLLGAHLSDRPVLGLVVDKWDSLPPAVRAGIAAMAHATYD